MAYSYIVDYEQENKQLRADLKLCREALETALDELHEVNLARRHHNPPRNPEMTVAAEAKVQTALARARQWEE